MIADGEKYKEAAMMQSSVYVEMSEGRGNIYDRNMLCFTSGGKKKTAVVVKSKNAEADFEICKILSRENPYEIYTELHAKGIVYHDVDWGFNENLLDDYKNVYVFENIKRYKNDGAGSAVLGYISAGSGVSGIEYAADKYLKNGDSKRFPLLKDAGGNLLPGLSYRTETNPCGMILKTTLDKKYIEICQNALKEKSGAAVLLEIPSFDLVAMVSSPTFDQNNVGKYLDDGEKPLINRAVSEYDMGSIFKIVVTAAALENGSVNAYEKFYCNGLKTVNNVEFLCRNHKQLPYLTLSDAFLHSCNAVFIDIGEKTSYNNIIDMACSFGFGENLICPEDFPQNAGILPDKDNYYLADVANLSIGQGKLLGTAVHGAYISAIIANDGIKNKINVLDSLLDEKAVPRVSLKTFDEQKVVSKETAKLIKEMMIKTVSGGTGKSANSAYVFSAGKTGSAQTGMRINDEACVHAWFTGFFPADNPKYALCVFVENGKSGGDTAAPIFKEIAEKIAVEEGW